MKIMFLSPGMEFNGAAKMISFVAESMCERGHEVTIAILRRSERMRPISPKIRTEVIEEKGMRGLRRLRQLRLVKKLVKEISPDIMVGFNFYPGCMVSMIGGALGIPSVMSERSDPSVTMTKKGFVYEYLWKKLNACDGGVFQTGGAMDYYLDALKKRATVIPNPIFVNGEVPHVPYSEREKTVVSLGRVEIAQKRVDIMLQAFEAFHKKHPDYVLRIYGKGKDLPMMEQMAADMGIADSVRFMGLTTQPMQEISKDGMFLITSDFEGISNSLLEAMAVGLPCVSTDHTPGGARLLITDHENGLLAPVADPEALAAAMCEFAENRELAEKCGEEARKVLTRFAPERIVDMWEEYLLRVAESKKKK